MYNTIYEVGWQYTLEVCQYRYSDHRSRRKTRPQARP